MPNKIFRRVASELRSITNRWTVGTLSLLLLAGLSTGCSSKSGGSSDKGDPPKPSLSKDPQGRVTMATFYQRVDARAIKALKEHTELEAVTIMECKQIDEEALFALRDLPTLVRLRILNAPFTDDDLAHLKEVTQLKQLILENTMVSGRGLANVRGLKNLTSISLTGESLNLDELETIGEHKQLVELSLGREDPKVAHLKALGELPNLESLTFRRAALEDDDFHRLAAIPKLLSLRLDASKLTDNGIGQIGKFPSLKTLAIPSAGITAAGVAHIASLAKLEVLDLQDATKVSSKAVQQLAKLKTLRRVNLCGTDIRGKVLLGLKEVPALQKVSVRAGQLSKADAKELKTAMPHCEIERLEAGPTPAG